MTSGRRGRTTALGAALGVVLAIVLLVLGIRLRGVHETTSDWVLWPRAVPSRVQFADRDYECGAHPGAGAGSVEGLVKRGTTSGGGDIYASSSSGATTWIVVAADNATYTCGLLGGP
ncbi:hypothetical protein RBS60_15720 [Sinomonas sp. ASV486]|uniref:Uncharacterized protein n=1 Tax=Sinomonas puerhi TaxID=3238584 RepID=A0AB39L3W5_9MICC|nr:hypothetical protein [Sinomonas sp. ASV486]MDQ4491650.1 hypothetical protein [Sinomonas sp. ASV486]